MAKVSSVEQGYPTMSGSAWLAREAKPVGPLQKDVDDSFVSVSFSLTEETIQQICSNPDPRTVFIVMVKRRRAEVKVPTLSAEQKRELVEAKDKELNTFVKYSLVQAASCQGISPFALMKTRRVVTFKVMVH